MNRSYLLLAATIAALLTLGMLSFANMTFYTASLVIGGSPWQLDYQRGGLDTLVFTILWAGWTVFWTWLFYSRYRFYYLPTKTGSDSS